MTFQKGHDHLWVRSVMHRRSVNPMPAKQHFARRLLSAQRITSRGAEFERRAEPAAAPWTADRVWPLIRACGCVGRRRRRKTAAQEKQRCSLARPSGNAACGRGDGKHLGFARACVCLEGGAFHPPPRPTSCGRRPGLKLFRRPHSFLFLTLFTPNRVASFPHSFCFLLCITNPPLDRRRGHRSVLLSVFSTAPVLQPHAGRLYIPSGGYFVIRERGADSAP